MANVIVLKKDLGPGGTLPGPHALVVSSNDYNAFRQARIKVNDETGLEGRSSHHEKRIEYEQEARDRTNKRQLLKLSKVCMKSILECS